MFAYFFTETWFSKPRYWPRIMVKTNGSLLLWICLWHKLSILCSVWITWLLQRWMIDPIYIMQPFRAQLVCWTASNMFAIFDWIPNIYFQKIFVKSFKNFQYKEQRTKKKTVEELLGLIHNIFTVFYDLWTKHQSLRKKPLCVNKKYVKC